MQIESSVLEDCLLELPACHTTTSRLWGRKPVADPELFETCWYFIDERKHRALAA